MAEEDNNTETTDNINDDLQASWTEVEEDTESSETDATPDTSEPDVVAETDDGEDTPTEENEVEVTADEDGKAEEPETVFQAPEHWSSEDKAAFEQLDPKGRELTLKFETDFQKGYQERAEGISEIQQAIEPWKQTIAQLGVSEGQAIRTLFATYNNLLSDPLSGVQQLAQTFGVLDQLSTPDTDDEFADPELKALRTQVQTLTNQLQGFSNNQEQAQLQGGQQVIADFKAAKDDAGNLKHEYFDDVAPLILPLVQQGKSLDEAYDEAKWSSPAFREKTQPEKGPTDIEKARKVKEARRAANTVKQKGNESSDAKEPDLTLDEELAAVFAEQST